MSIRGGQSQARLTVGYRCVPSRHGCGDAGLKFDPTQPNDDGQGSGKRHLQGSIHGSDHISFSLSE